MDTIDVFSCVWHSYLCLYTYDHFHYITGVPIWRHQRLSYHIILQMLGWFAILSDARFTDSFIHCMPTFNHTLYKSGWKTCFTQHVISFSSFCLQSSRRRSPCSTKTAMEPSRPRNWAQLCDPSDRTPQRLNFRTWSTRLTLMVRAQRPVL